MIRRCFSAIALLLVIAAVAAAQGAPPIRWMRGGHTGPIYQLVYSADGSFFASAGAADHTVKIWRVSDGMLLRTLYVPRGSVAMALSPDNSTLCAGGGSTVTTLPLIRCWHVADWSVSWTAETSRTRSPATTSPSCRSHRTASGWHRLWRTACQSWTRLTVRGSRTSPAPSFPRTTEDWRIRLMATCSPSTRRATSTTWRC